MSYCTPAWISDYNYQGLMDWRSVPSVAGGASPAATCECLIVWGTVRGDSITLHPALVARIRDAMPRLLAHSSGEHEVIAYGLLLIAIMIFTGIRQLSPYMLMMPLMMVMATVGFMAGGGPGGKRVPEINADRKEYLRYLAGLRTRVTSSASPMARIVRDFPGVMHSSTAMAR